MKKLAAINVLSGYDKKGRFIYTLNDLKKIFHQDAPRALKASIERLVRDGILTRAAMGVYVFSMADSKDANMLEHIAKALRRGEYNYVSLESALSEYGVISQIPVDRLMIMTTGRSAEHKTPFGTIELTHTKRQPMDIIRNTKIVGRPLRLATKQTALRDMKRVGRNTHLIDEESLHED